MPGLRIGIGFGVGAGERKDGGDRNVFFDVPAASGGNDVGHPPGAIDGEHEERAGPALHTDTLTHDGETHCPILRLLNCRSTMAGYHRQFRLSTALRPLRGLQDEA